MAADAGGIGATCGPATVSGRLRAAGCVFAEDEERLLASAARTRNELADMVDRRVAGVPLEQVLGWADFCGRRVALEPGVFVPRRRSELLVRQALTLADGLRRRVVVDLCCGSGAVGVAVAAALERAELHAVDVDPVAVRCARRNVPATLGRVYQGDLDEPLPQFLRGRVDLLLANAPYVPSDEIRLLPPEARLHEPRRALDGGADGLDVQRRIAAAAPAWLAPGGSLLLETGKGQAQRTLDIVAGAGLAATVVTCDELEATVVIGTRSLGGTPELE